MSTGAKAQGVRRLAISVTGCTTSATRHERSRTTVVIKNRRCGKMDLLYVFLFFIFFSSFPLTAAFRAPKPLKIKKKWSFISIKRKKIIKHKTTPRYRFRKSRIERRPEPLFSDRRILIFFVSPPPLSDFSSQCERGRGGGEEKNTNVYTGTCFNNSYVTFRL